MKALKDDPPSVLLVIEGDQPQGGEDGPMSKWMEALEHEQAQMRDRIEEIHTTLNGINATL